MNEINTPVISSTPQVYSVSSLTEELISTLEEHFDFIWVEGEISNFRIPASGHYYFSLKDDQAQIRAVMFRPQSRYLKFMPEDGMNVLAQGRVTIYKPRGEYQIILDYLEPLGIGALALAFDQLKKKLASEGLFDEEIKKPLPFLPKKVAVITSPTGAAIRDFLKIIHRRFANIEVIIIPVKVQGEGAPKEIIDALEIANKETDADVIVLTRGGGSLEDLWAFNNEELAYKIRASQIPVVSAIGHEIDITISDLVADLRAPTPSAAAEFLVREKESLKDDLAEIKRRLRSGLNSILSHQIQMLDFFRRGLRDPRKELSDSWFRLDDLHGRLLRSIKLYNKEFKTRLAAEYRTLSIYSPIRLYEQSKQKIEFQKYSMTTSIEIELKDKKSNLLIFEEKMKDLSPLAVLKRGYSISRNIPDNTILKSSADVKKGDRIRVKLAQGEVKCRIESTNNS